MNQQKAWEGEYDTQRFVSFASEASQEVKNFARFLRKTEEVDFEDTHVLDLGSGIGKNAEYFASLGANVTGFEFARNALEEAKRRSQELELSITYLNQNIGAQYPLPDASVDVALDVMSSNSLTESERAVYLKELKRALKPCGYIFFRGLCKDGDKNAQNLLKTHPWEEKDTYVMPESNFHERVFSESNLLDTYTPFFTILKKEKKTNYTRFQGVSYKRNYWVVYMKNE